MSISTRDQIMIETAKHKLTPVEKLVFAKMLYCANKDGYYTAGFKLLSTILDIDKSQLSRAIKKLMACGIITRTRTMENRSQYAIAGILNSCQIVNGELSNRQQRVDNMTTKGCQFDNPTYQYKTTAATSRHAAGGLPRTGGSAAKRDRRPVTK